MTGGSRQEEGYAGGHRDVTGAGTGLGTAGSAYGTEPRTEYTGGVAGGPAYGGTEVRGGRAGRQAGERAACSRVGAGAGGAGARGASAARQHLPSHRLPCCAHPPPLVPHPCSASLQGAAYTERAEGYAEVPVVQQVRGGSW